MRKKYAQISTRKIKKSYYRNKISQMAYLDMEMWGIEVLIVIYYTKLDSETHRQLACHIQNTQEN